MGSRGKCGSVNVKDVSVCAAWQRGAVHGTPKEVFGWERVGKRERHANEGLHKHGCVPFITGKDSQMRDSIS